MLSSFFIIVIIIDGGTHPNFVMRGERSTAGALYPLLDSAATKDNGLQIEQKVGGCRQDIRQTF